MDEKSTEIAARRFLKTGKITDVDEEALAAACERQVQLATRKSLTNALPICRRFAERANGSGSKVLQLAAYRALARVTHMSGAHASARTAYLRARRLSGKQPLVRARIDRALVDVYMYLGRFKQAQTSAQRAMAVFRRLKSESDLAQTRVNYANLLHRQDRHRDAERLYRDAAHYFETVNNALAAARCHYNRANTLVQLFELEEAEDLYQRAARAYEDAGLVLEANDARYGLAWLKMLRGDFHVALSDLNECQIAYRAGGDPRGEALCKLDRAEVCLGLGLYQDALEASREAERLFSKLGLRYENAKSALFRAQAAMSLGVRTEALAAIDRAIDGFRREKNNAFQGVAHLFAADLSNDVRKRQREAEIARSRFQKAQLPLWEAICDLRDAFDPQHAADTLNRLKRNRAVMHVPHLYAMWQTALGDREQRRGQIELARRCWTNAADRLDFVRAQLPPIELRSSFAQRTNSPHLRLISTASAGEPKTASAWSERYNTAGVWAPLPVHGPESTVRHQVGRSLDALAAQVALLSRNLSGYGGERGIGAVVARKTVVALQRKVREGLIAAEKVNRSGIDSIDRLQAEFARTSKTRPIVQFHLEGDDVLAFVHQDGQTELRRLAGARRQLDRLHQKWRFVLESELLADRFGQNMSHDVENDLWSELGTLLWRSLPMPMHGSRVLVLPQGELANIPWGALIVDGKQLAEEYQFVVAPSLRHHLAACRVDVTSEKIEVFRGVSADIPNVDDELRLLIERGGDRAVVHDHCRRSDWPAEGSARVWHFAGHAVLRSDNPFYSYLLLEDGPMFAADFRLKQCNVGLVTLAACRTGQQVTMPGEEATGLVRSLLEMGARNVLAGHWPVSDRGAAMWMGAFYERFLAGGDLLGSASHAAETMRKNHPSAFYWAAFSVFGAGDMGETNE